MTWNWYVMAKLLGKLSLLVDFYLRNDAYVDTLVSGTYFKALKVLLERRLLSSVPPGCRFVLSYESLVSFFSLCRIFWDGLRPAQFCFGPIARERKCEPITRGAVLWSHYLFLFRHTISCFLILITHQITELHQKFITVIKADTTLITQTYYINNKTYNWDFIILY